MVDCSLHLLDSFYFKRTNYPRGRFRGHYPRGRFSRQTTPEVGFPEKVLYPLGDRGRFSVSFFLKLSKLSE